MNTLFENTLLKMGVGLQTMSAPKVPAMLKNLFKSQTPLEKLNQERASLGYDPLTQSEWLAGAGGVVAQGLSDDSEDWIDTMFSHHHSDIIHNPMNIHYDETINS